MGLTLYHWGRRRVKCLQPTVDTGEQSLYLTSPMKLAPLLLALAGCTPVLDTTGATVRTTVALVQLIEVEGDSDRPLSVGLRARPLATPTTTLPRRPLRTADGRLVWPK